MALSTTWWRSLSGVALLLLARHVDAQCVTNLNGIFVQETSLSVLNSRTYNLCRNSYHRPGRITGSGLQGTTFPLYLRSNSTVRCTTLGLPGGNCTIDGSEAEHALFFYPAGLQEGGETFLDKILVNGITFKNFRSEAQVALFIAGRSGDVKFRDCVFEDIGANPAFFMVLQLPQRRRRELELPDPEEEEHRRLIAETDDPDVKLDTAHKLLKILSKKITKLYPEHQKRMQEGGYEPEDPQDPEDLSNEPVEIIDGHRRAQGVDTSQPRLLVQVAKSTFRLTVQEADADADKPGGRTIFFVGRANGVVETISGEAPNLDLFIFNNYFIDNDFDFPNDVEPYRTFVDFFSSGFVSIQRNCFENSPLTVSPGSALVIIHQDPTNFRFRRNHVANPQSLDCDGIAVYSRFDYTFRFCAELPTTPQVPFSETCQRGEGVPGENFCFSGDMAVDVQGKGTIPMRDLQLGDYVKTTASGDYHQVFSFGHFDRDGPAEYLHFMPSGLEMSSNHMVYLKDSAQPVPASMVRVGDVLENQEKPVSKIRTVFRDGAYAPFTTSGELLVNGVKVSSYVAFQNAPSMTVGGIDTGISYQWIARASQVPHMLYCAYVPGATCSTEEYTEDGLSQWIAVPWEMAQWITAGQNTWLLAAAVVPIMALLGSFALLGALFLEQNPAAIAMVLVVTTALAMRRMNVGQTKTGTLKLRL